MLVPIEIIKEAIEKKELYNCIPPLHRHGKSAICHERIYKHSKTRKILKFYTVLLTIENRELTREKRGNEYNENEVKNLEPLSKEYYEKLENFYNLKNQAK